MTQKARGNRRKGRVTARPPKDTGRWSVLTLLVLVAVLVLRVGVNALEPVPVHAGEAALWAYGQELDWGYLAEPPLAAWVVRVLTGLGGDTLFMLRLASPLAHALTAWLIFLAGKRMWGGETGFWAAAGYTAAPGAALSAMVMSAHPLLLVLWALSLWLHLRAAEAEGPWVGRVWWALFGLAVGAGMLAGYAMTAFVLAALGYGLVSARARDWPGVAVAAVAAALVMLPNIVWDVSHDFAGAAQAVAAADPGQGDVDPLRLAAFVGAQFAVIGPVFLIAIWLAVRNRAAWREDWGMRLIAWQCLPLILATAVAAVFGRGDWSWAAPAYVAGSLLAARWLVTAGGWPALRSQLGIGVAASLLLWAAAGLYAGQAERLTWRLDPFRQMRLGGPFCELVLGYMAEEGAGVLLSDNRLRLSECMFQGGLGWDEVAIWNPDRLPDNHHELVAGLQPGDDRTMLLAVHGGAAQIARHFRDAREIESLRLVTHIDGDVGLDIWAVQGFKGY